MKKKKYWIIYVIINIATIIIATISTIIVIIMCSNGTCINCIDMDIYMTDKNIHFITVFEANISSRNKYGLQDMYPIYTAIYEEIRRQRNVCVRYHIG